MGIVCKQRGNRPQPLSTYIAVHQAPVGLKGDTNGGRGGRPPDVPIGRTQPL